MALKTRVRIPLFAERIKYFVMKYILSVGSNIYAKKRYICAKKYIFFVDHTLKFFLKLRRIAFQKEAESLEAAIGSTCAGGKGFSSLFCRTVFQYCGVRRNKVPSARRWSARNMQSKKNPLFFFA